MELLRRLRRPGVPGAARAAGVPADLAAEMSAELEPVFRALAGAVAAADATRQAAAVQGDELVETARRDAARLAEDARSRAAGVAAEATAARLRQLESDRQSVLEAADREADRVRSLAAERSPRLVERIVQVALELPRTGGPG